MRVSLRAPPHSISRGFFLLLAQTRDGAEQGILSFPPSGWSPPVPTRQGSTCSVSLALSLPEEPIPLL